MTKEEKKKLKMFKGGPLGDQSTVGGQRELFLKKMEAQR
jgi:hypothetical protein